MSSLVSAAGKKLSRAWKAASGTVTIGITACAGVIKGIIRKYGALPRTARIITVYLLILLVTGGIFLWRTAGLRHSSPDSSRWSFDFAEIPDEWEQYLVNATTEDGGSRETEAVDYDPAAESGVTEREDSTPSPVFQRGIWPVNGELLYSYDSITREETPVSTIINFSTGIAIKSSAGTAVQAVWDGVVIKVSYPDVPYGTSVAIQHDFDLVSYYGALGSASVNEGDTVKQGEIIGTVKEGDGQEPSHLFLKILEDGIHVDPEDKLHPR